MYAVVETGGKQVRVAPGEKISVEKLPGESGSTVYFDKVLLVSDGDQVRVGHPYLDGVRVVGELLESARGKKIRVFTYKSKKNERRRMGHRQWYTAVRIQAIEG